MYLYIILVACLKTHYASETYIYSIFHTKYKKDTQKRKKRRAFEKKEYI
jgi:hypothetical protein